MAPNFKTREISPKRGKTPFARRFQRGLPMRKEKSTCKKERENYSSRRLKEIRERERYKRKITYRTSSRHKRRELRADDEKYRWKCSNDNRSYHEQRFRRNSSNSDWRSQRRDENNRSKDRDSNKIEFIRKNSRSCEKSSCSSSSSIERNYICQGRSSNRTEFRENQNPVISLPARAPLVSVFRRILLPSTYPRPLIKPQILPGPCMRVPCLPRVLRPFMRPVIRVVPPYAAARHPVMPLRLPVVPTGSQLNFTVPSIQYVIERQ